MKEWMHEGINACMKEWMNEWHNLCMNGWMIWWINGWMIKLLSKSLWKNECMNDKKMDENI